MQPLTLLLTMAMCHTIFAVPVAGKEIKKVKEPKVSGWKILKYTAVGGLLTVPTIAISTVIAAVCAKASKDSKKQKDAGHTQRQGSSPGYTSPLYTTDTSDISYTPNTSDSPYTHYTTDTSLYDSEEATNAAEKSYTDDEKSTKDRNTEQDELEIDNEIEETNNPENIGEPAKYIDKIKQSYTPNTPYTPYTPSYGYEKATNAAEKNHTDDESSTKDRNTEEDELEIDNEIETEITAETNVAEGNISPGTNISVATSSQVGQSSDISSAAVESDKDVQYPIIATAAVKATSAPPSIEKKEHVHKPAIYIDENEQFQKLLKKVRDRPEKDRYTGHRIDIEWEDIQDYTDEQIELLRQGALPRANVQDLIGINFSTPTLENANDAFGEEAAYRIMKALMFAGSSLAVTSYNAKILKAMARAQRENTRNFQGVEVHSLVTHLDGSKIPVTRDVVLPDSQVYSLPLLPGEPVIEWSVLKMESQGEMCQLATEKGPYIEGTITVTIQHEEGGVVGHPDLKYSLFKYQHPTEPNQSILKIKESEPSPKYDVNRLGDCQIYISDQYTQFECNKPRLIPGSKRGRV